MIPVTKLRELTLERAEGDESSSHVSAASGMVHVGETLFVIADDEKQLSIFPREAQEPGRQITILSGAKPKSQEELKTDKPDLESIVLLQPSEHFEHGALLTLGSGTKDRDRGALVALGPDGLPAGDAREIELTPLFDELRSRIEGFNAEGCAATGDSLHLFQRGNAEGSINARVDLSLDAVTGSLAGGASLNADHITGITSYELGLLGGVGLCFSDAAPLPDGRIVFTCSAESTGPGEDGKVTGSALGVMSADGEVTFLEPIDLDVKIEGMTAMSEDGGAIRVLLVADADDPDSPSPLFEAWLPDS